MWWHEDDNDFYSLFVSNRAEEFDGNNAHIIFFQLAKQIFFKLTFYPTSLSYVSICGCGYFFNQFSFD